MRRDRAARVENVRDIGLTIFAQRRRHANDDGLTFFDAAEIGRGRKTILANDARQCLIGNMFDVTTTPIDEIDLCLIDIEPKNSHIDPRKLDGEGQTDVTKTY